MVSFNVYRATASGAYVEGVCLTSDEKPIAGIANGSILYAVDTSDGSMTKYMYNQSGASWIAVEDSGSGGGDDEGGGSGGESNVLPVLFTLTGTGTQEDPFSVTCDTSMDDMLAAQDAGKVILAKCDLEDIGFYDLCATAFYLERGDDYDNMISQFIHLGGALEYTQAVQVEFDGDDFAAELLHPFTPMA